MSDKQIAILVALGVLGFLLYNNRSIASDNGGCDVNHVPLESEGQTFCLPKNQRIVQG